VTDTRNRAFTLLIEAYDDARRAVQYIRYHENDAETIATNTPKLTPDVVANGPYVTLS
jgi:hypothetical protein